MKQYRQYLILGSIFLLALLLIYRKDLSAFAKRKTGSKTTSLSGEENIDFDRKLMVGSSGEEVTVLQQAIIKDGGQLPIFGDDGIFGNETKRALLSIKGVSETTLNQYKSTGSKYDFSNIIVSYQERTVQEV